MVKKKDFGDLYDFKFRFCDLPAVVLGSNKVIV